MKTILSYLTRNKNRLAKFLYLAGALIEQIPDYHRPAKTVRGRVISTRRRPHGKR